MSAATTRSDRGPSPVADTPRTTSATVGLIAEPLQIPTAHHARQQLNRIEQLVLAMWTTAMSEVDNASAARFCSAHRAIHEAILLLDDSSQVVAEVGPYPDRLG